MYPQSGHSLRRFNNQDGSYNVYCYICGEWICRTWMAGVGRAICELCRRVEAGENLTEEAVRDYKLQKADKLSDVTAVIVPDELPKGAQKFTIRSMVGDVIQAFGFIKKQKPKAEKSVAVSKAKKRDRIFAQVDLAQDLGSITELDKKLEKNK